jgi:hypothetical protein
VQITHCIQRQRCHAIQIVANFPLQICGFLRFGRRECPGDLFIDVGMVALKDACQGEGTEVAVAGGVFDRRSHGSITVEIEQSLNLVQVDSGADEGRLPEWCNVYEGLADEEIADLEKTILTRADLSP